MNNVNFIGRITKDADIRKTQSGKSVAQFSLAVDRPFTFGDNKQTDFFNIVWWLKRDVVAEYLKKGQQVGVTGYIQNRSYEGKDGQKRYITEVVVNTLDFIGKAAKQEQPELSKGAGTTDDGSIPF